MANLTYDNRVNRSIVAEMRDNQNRQQELFGRPDMMPYRGRPRLTGGGDGYHVLSGNNPTSNMGARDGLVTMSPMIAAEELSEPQTGSGLRGHDPMRGHHAGMRTANTGNGFDFGKAMKAVQKTINLIPLKTRRNLSKKALDAINDVDAEDIARLAGNGWFQDHIIDPSKKLINYIPLDVRRKLTKNTVKFINAISADDVKALSGSGLNLGECRKRGKMEGGSFWNDIVKTVKKGVKSVKKGVKKYVPIIVKGAKSAASEIKKDVETVVDLIPPKIRKAIKNKTIEVAPEVLSGALSAAALAVGQPELVPVAGIVGTVAGKMVQKQLKGSGTDGRARRAAIVKKIMKDRGVKMIEASKIVKSEGLYKK
jgi:hypothetical protein|tara:strand:+ start:14318 stop:15421 length:1104 start_codon:yes stop_codon:yes gene_type:complete